MNEMVDSAALLRCAYTNIRRVDRTITRFYEEALTSVDISIAQFALLATLSEVNPITINRLATLVEVDRTTLTRNLALLTKKQLIHCEEGADRRERLVHLTPTGEHMFLATLPLWQEAQSQIEHKFGPERFATLLAELTEITDLIR